MNILKQIITGASDYEDGETGLDSCIDQYCEDHAIDSTTCEQAKRKAFRDMASEAGIPLSVIEGRSKLSDHFSKSYIESQCSKNLIEGKKE